MKLKKMVIKYFFYAIFISFSYSHVLYATSCIDSLRQFLDITDDHHFSKHNIKEIRRLIKILSAPYPDSYSLEQLKSTIKLERERLDWLYRKYNSFNPAKNQDKFKQEKYLALNQISTFYLEIENAHAFATERQAYLEAIKAISKWTRDNADNEVINQLIIPTSNSVKNAIRLVAQRKFQNQLIDLSRLTNEYARWFEAHIAYHIDQIWGNILAFNQHFIFNGIVFGEIDISMGKALVEVTTSKNGKMDQVFEKYFSNKMNPHTLPVILYSENYSIEDSCHLMLVAIRKKLPLVVVKSLNELSTVLNIIYPPIP